MKKQEFINSLKPSFQEEYNGFGYYPFQIIAIKGDIITISAIIDIPSVLFVYKHIKKFIDDGYTTIYTAVDFPPIQGIETDSIVVFIYENNKVINLAIPYDTDNGDMLEHVTDCEGLKRILQNYNHLVLNEELNIKLD